MRNSVSPSPPGDGHRLRNPARKSVHTRRAHAVRSCEKGTVQESPPHERRTDAYFPKTPAQRLLFSERNLLSSYPRLFDLLWGSGGKAGIWTWANGPVHLLPADPRRSFGFFSPAEKRNPPAGGTTFLKLKKSRQKTFCETPFRPRRLQSGLGSAIQHERACILAGRWRTAAPTDLWWAQFSCAGERD